jgi:16S rRNA (guanine527-N7)-methyltransferase
MLEKYYQQHQQQIDAYVHLLLEENQKMNLIGKSTENQIIQRHIYDCLQLIKHISPNVDEIIDLGTGAGLPGIILAIAMQNQKINFTLCEKSRKKCQFLEKIILQLNLKNAQLFCENLYQQFPIKPTLRNKNFVIVSRAFKPISEILAIMQQHNLIKPNFNVILLKGERYKQELQQAMQQYKFNYTINESEINQGFIININFKL